MRINPLLAALAAVMAASAVPAHSAVVRLGVSNDRSGIYSELGGLGAEMAVRMAGEDFGGKVAGKTVEVIGADNQNKADVASALVRRWFDTQGLASPRKKAAPR
ncbi:hypothetical protein G6F31_020256 [Rhizopus arrhizus]|nr:hypothetical protein G6F31_020256 [Rhizopus arrhizus]